MPADASTVVTVRGIAIASGTCSKRRRIRLLGLGCRQDRRNLHKTRRPNGLFPDSGSLPLSEWSRPWRPGFLTIGTPRRLGTKPHLRGGRGTVGRVTVGGVAEQRHSPRCAVSPCLMVSAQSSAAGRSDLGAPRFATRLARAVAAPPRDLAAGVDSISRGRAQMRQQVRAPFLAACLGARSGV
jgi:hypothetical protein